MVVKRLRRGLSKQLFSHCNIWSQAALWRNKLNNVAGNRRECLYCSVTWDHRNNARGVSAEESQWRTEREITDVPTCTAGYCHARSGGCCNLSESFAHVIKHALGSWTKRKNLVGCHKKWRSKITKHMKKIHFLRKIRMLCNRNDAHNPSSAQADHSNVLR